MTCAMPSETMLSTITAHRDYDTKSSYPLAQEKLGNFIAYKKLTSESSKRVATNFFIVRANSNNAAEETMSAKS